MTTPPVHHGYDPLQKRRIQISVLAIVAGTVIFGIKTLAYITTGSTALKSDAIESLVNIVAGFFALGAVIFAGRPADKNHPYGHGKIEHFSAAFEGGLISLAAAIILFEGAKSFWVGVPPKDLNVGLYLNLAAGALNGVLGVILLRTGKSTKSKALEADGHHILSDFYTTLALGVGVFIMKVTGFYWMDPIMAIVVGLLLAYTGFKLVKSSSAALLDSEDPELIERIAGLINKVRTPDIVTVHELRTMRSGRFTHVDVHIVVPEFYEIKKAHYLVESFGERIIKEAQFDGEFHSHIDPCEMLYCKSCSFEPCPIRKEAFRGLEKVTVDSATASGPKEYGMKAFKEGSHG